MATALERLRQAREDLITTLALEEAYQAAHGPKPSYSLDGESYSWTEWRTACLAQIEAFNRLIQAERPYQISSRGRP